MRMIRMSFLYRAAIVGVLGLRRTLLGEPLHQTWLAKPVLDEVILPASQSSFDLAAIAPRLWEIGAILGVQLVITPPTMFLRLYLANWVVARVRQDVDRQVARKFLSAPLRLHRGEASGELLSRALTDAHLACRALEVLYKDVLEDFMLLVRRRDIHVPDLVAALPALDGGDADPARRPRAISAIGSRRRRSGARRPRAISPSG